MDIYPKSRPTQAEIATAIALARRERSRVFHALIADAWAGIGRILTERPTQKRRRCPA